MPRLALFATTLLFAAAYRVGCDCGPTLLSDGGVSAPDASAADAGLDAGAADAGFSFCGTGACDGGETCSSCAHDCGVCVAVCNGTAGQWSGCRGNGCAVCLEKLTGYAHYFVNHPACDLNVTCAGLFFTCNASCPAPTAADR